MHQVASKKQVSGKGEERQERSFTPQDSCCSHPHPSLHAPCTLPLQFLIFCIPTLAPAPNQDWIQGLELMVRGSPKWHFPSTGCIFLDMEARSGFRCLLDCQPQSRRAKCKWKSRTEGVCAGADNAGQHCLPQVHPGSCCHGAAFQQSAKCQRAARELEVISALGGFLRPQPGGFRVPWRSSDCWVLGDNAGVSLSTDVTLSA